MLTSTYTKRLFLRSNSVTTSFSSMDSIRVNRSELVGKSQNNTAVLESLVRANSLNQTGYLDYNENGKLDGVGFEKVSPLFIDNFILKVVVPDYNTEKIKGKRTRNMFVASQNKTIRDLLAVNGFEKPNVKAVSLNKLHHGNPPEEMLKRMPNTDFDKIADVYYIQEYKIATPNIEYATVMNFLRNVNYKGYGFFLNDVDITIDYAGSFNKNPAKRGLP